MKIQNQGFDHVEFVVRDINKHGALYEAMGFEKIGFRHDKSKGTRSSIYAQGFVRMIFTESDGSPQSNDQESIKFLNNQAEGICVLALDVDDATRAFEETVKLGAQSAMMPKKYEGEFGTVVRSEIWTPGKIRYAFMERTSAKGASRALFDEGLTVDRLESPSPFGIRVIDHLTNNVQMGDLKIWADWYQKIFGFQIIRHFDIRTGRTGLVSDAVQSLDKKITVPINEATEKESQVQEFVDRMKGAGVQHLAFLSQDIIFTLQKLASIGMEFLKVPSTYYEVVPKRVPGVTEDLKVLEKLGILLDSEGAGYLMQIFSKEIVGPFFFEFIQRKGNNGFGEGNFRALFEAIERDQINRGVLKA